MQDGDVSPLKQTVDRGKIQMILEYQRGFSAHSQFVLGQNQWVAPGLIALPLQTGRINRDLSSGSGEFSPRDSRYWQLNSDPSCPI